MYFFYPEEEACCLENLIISIVRGVWIPFDLLIDGKGNNKAQI